MENWRRHVVAAMTRIVRIGLHRSKSRVVWSLLPGLPAVVSALVLLFILGRSFAPPRIGCFGQQGPEGAWGEGGRWPNATLR